MALVITRKPGQSFTIGDNITVTILKNPRPNTKSVRVAIDAPKEMAIRRDDMITGRNKHDVD